MPRFEGPPFSRNRSAFGSAVLPAVARLSGRKLASIEPPTNYGTIQPLFGRRIRTDIIHEHSDDVLRLVTSLKTGTVLPSAMLKRLAAYQRQNPLDFALRELGRIECTLFMLDWLGVEQE